MVPGGHEPEDDWEAQLVSIIARFRRLSGDLRFGQFLFLALAEYDKRCNGGILDPNYNEDFHTRLFFTEDKELANIMLKAIKDNKEFLETLKTT